MSSLATSALSKERLAKANAKRNKTQKKSVPPVPFVPPESPFPVGYPEKKKNKEKQKSRVNKQIQDMNTAQSVKNLFKSEEAKLAPSVQKLFAQSKNLTKNNKGGKYKKSKRNRKSKKSRRSRR